MTPTDLIWTGPAGPSLPSDASSAVTIVPYAQGLTKKQQDHVILAFESHAFDMGAEYVWRRSMIRLRNALKTLGMKFIGEMVGNLDIDELSNIEAVLTDYQTITLAEQLGIINTTGGLKLKQALEIITHFFSPTATQEGEELSAVDGIQIVTSCVKYILGEQDMSVSVQFSLFRERLYSETLSKGDLQVQQLLSSPTFYVRTVINVLLSPIRNSEGAQLEHSLANINLLLPLLWPNMAESDRWAIGTAYRDVTSDGKVLAAKGLKAALMKVSGFDFVPENLRSSTYKKAAKAIIDAHFDFNNFYTEPALVKALNSLGTTIPSPALIDCIQAYLCVCLGNRYGISWDAVPVARKSLRQITGDRWFYYLSKAVQTDEPVLTKLAQVKEAPSRMSEILESAITRDEVDKLSGLNQRLARALLDKDYPRVSSVSQAMLGKLRP